MNDDGFVFVSDEFHNNVSIFSIDGKFVENWGKIGNAEGQLDGPSGLAIKPNGNILVVDQNNHRVQEFSKSGEYVNSWGSFGNETGQLNQPWGFGERLPYLNGLRSFWTQIQMNPASVIFQI